MQRKKKRRKKKEEREKKKAGKAEALENNMEKRTQNWMNGINKDLTRLATNLSDVDRVPDEETKDQFYSALFFSLPPFFVFALYNFP